jgi:hypothetical protein
MQSTSDSGRPTTAPNPAPGTENHVLPRGKLVVEVYVAEQPIQQPSRSVQRANRLRGSSRVWAAVVVIGLHATFGVWLWTSTNGLRLLHREPPESLVMLDPIAPPQAHPDPAMPLPSPDLLPPPPEPPLPKLFKSGSSEIAVSITASTDVLISNADPRDVEGVLAGCRADKTRPMPQLLGAAEVTLLARVEKVGRVSDSRIEVGSGTQRVDEAAQRCLLAHGFLTPRRVNGEPVASWQRVHWPALSTEARLL